MRVTIVAAGRCKDPAIAAMVESYRQRCPMLTPLVEVESRRRADDPQRRDDEARLLLAAADGAEIVTALDERGRQFTSQSFAEQIRAWRDRGIRDLALLIGGADGHGSTVLDRADVTLALSTMTWPHLLVRVMLAEQIYRASTILSGHPYHRQ